jgi:hypothetical protein
VTGPDPEIGASSVAGACSEVAASIGCSDVEGPVIGLAHVERMAPAPTAPIVSAHVVTSATGAGTSTIMLNNPWALVAGDPRVKVSLRLEQDGVVVATVSPGLDATWSKVQLELVDGMQHRFRSQCVLELPWSSELLWSAPDLVEPHPPLITMTTDTGTALQLHNPGAQRSFSRLQVQRIQQEDMDGFSWDSVPILDVSVATHVSEHVDFEVQDQDFSAWLMVRSRYVIEVEGGAWHSLWSSALVVAPRPLAPVVVKCIESPGLPLGSGFMTVTLEVHNPWGAVGSVACPCVGVRVALNGVVVATKSVDPASELKAVLVEVKNVAADSLHRFKSQCVLGGASCTAALPWSPEVTWLVPSVRPARLVAFGATNVELELHCPAWADSEESEQSSRLELQYQRAMSVKDLRWGGALTVDLPLGLSESPRRELVRYLLREVDFSAWLHIRHRGVVQRGEHVLYSSWSTVVVVAPRPLPPVKLKVEDSVGTGAVSRVVLEISNPWATVTSTPGPCVGVRVMQDGVVVATEAVAWNPGLPSVVVIVPDVPGGAIYHFRSQCLLDGDSSGLELPWSEEVVVEVRWLQTFASTVAGSVPGLLPSPTTLALRPVFFFLVLQRKCICRLLQVETPQPPWSPSSASSGWEVVSPPLEPRLAALATSTSVAPGFGMCASRALELVAVSSQADCSIQFFNLRPACEGPAPLLPLLRVGKKGFLSLEFDFSNLGGWMCFTPYGTLLVAEGDNRRVQELRLERAVDGIPLSVTHEKYFGRSPRGIALLGPRVVTSNRDVVVVSDWLPGASAGPRLVVYDARDASSRKCICPTGIVRLREPFGVRLSRDGRLVFVTDAGSHCVLVHRLDADVEDMHVLCSVGLNRPIDVLEGERGLLVANLDGRDGNTLMHVPWDGVSATAMAHGGVGAGGDIAPAQAIPIGRGALRSPSALAFVPDVGILVRESADRLHQQLFVKWLL